MNSALYIIIGSVAAALAFGGAMTLWLHPKMRTPPDKRSPGGSKPSSSTNTNPSLPVPAVSDDQLAKLSEAIIERYEQTIQAAATRFETDLATTSTQMGETIKRMTTEIISQELESYRHGLEEMRKQAMQVAAQIQTAVESQNKALATGMEAEMQAQRQHMATVIDTQLADIVSSYILESLGNKVDLGAQGEYLFAMLEEHKADMKKELTNEA